MKKPNHKVVKMLPRTHDHKRRMQDHLRDAEKHDLHLTAQQLQDFFWVWMPAEDRARLIQMWLDGEF